MAAERKLGSVAARRSHAGERSGLAKRRGETAGAPDGTGMGMPQIQRARLLTAAISVVDELGCDEASVARITGCAGVSRRTFYELFEDRDECLLTVLRSAAKQAGERIVAELGESEPRAWRERVRQGLWILLRFFDDDLKLARVCVVQLQHGGRAVQKARLEVLEQLAAILDEGRAAGTYASAQSELTAQGLIGGVVAILQDQLAKGPDRPLSGLLGELMAMIVLPYLGPATSRRERERTLPAALPSGRASEPIYVCSMAEQAEMNSPRARSAERAAAADRASGGIAAGSAQATDVLAHLPMRLTYRTVKVLEGLAACAGSSNREVADRAGVSDQGQISKLLGRLQRLGLVVNDQAGAATRGERNRWSLTPGGMRLVDAIGSYQAAGVQRAVTSKRGMRQ